MLPEGTQMALVSDGLLGGMAIELVLPEEGLAESGERLAVAHGAYLPTTYVPGLMESVQGALIAHVDETVQDVDSLIGTIRAQLEGDHIQSALENVDRVSGDLTSVSSDLKRMMSNQMPRIVSNADTAIANLNTVVADIKAADLKTTVARVDTAVGDVKAIVADVRAQEGTLGQLIYNKSLYNHIDATVISADSLLTDIKAHPKRYVNITVFGKKEK